MFFVSVRSSSTEHPSGGDATDLPGLYPDRDHRTRTYETPSTVNTTIESKTRREKINSKGQQDEEEERGTDFNRIKSIFISSMFRLEMIEVYDGNATFRNGTPRCISVPKQASYNQILVRRIRKRTNRFDSSSSWFFSLFRELPFAHSISMMIAQNIV